MPEGGDGGYWEDDDDDAHAGSSASEDDDYGIDFPVKVTGGGRDHVEPR